MFCNKNCSFCIIFQFSFSFRRRERKYLHWRSVPSREANKNIFYVSFLPLQPNSVSSPRHILHLGRKIFLKHLSATSKIKSIYLLLQGTLSFYFYFFSYRKFLTKEYFMTLSFIFMQINYMMINSESQLCERTKKYVKRQKEKLGRKPTFNFSGDFF